MSHPGGTHSRYVIGCCLIPLGIYGLKNNSRRITYGIGCVWGMPSLSPLSSLAWNYKLVRQFTSANMRGQRKNDFVRTKFLGCILNNQIFFPMALWGAFARVIASRKKVTDFLSDQLKPAKIDEHNRWNIVSAIAVTPIRRVFKSNLVNRLVAYNVSTDSYGCPKFVYNNSFYDHLLLSEWYFLPCNFLSASKCYWR